MIPSDRAHRVVLGTIMERLEHVPGRIGARITSEIPGFGQFLAFFEAMVWAIENLIISLDRTHRILLGTGIERLKQLPRRIDAGITRIGSQVHLRHFIFIFFQKVK